jgi:hypothetical protein
MGGGGGGGAKSYDGETGPRLSLYHSIISELTNMTYTGSVQWTNYNKNSVRENTELAHSFISLVCFNLYN